MPNANRPSGLSPLEYLNGSPYTGKARMYFIPQGDTNAYAIGDPVNLAGNADARGVASVVLATAGAGNPILGAIVGAGTVTYGASGIDPTTTGNSTVIPAAKTKPYYVLVSDDPNIVYEVQEVSSGTTLTAAEVGLNADLVAGANNGFTSGWQLNNAGEGTGATLQVKILGLVQSLDNEIGQHAKWKVLINNHPFKAGVAGI